MFNFRVDFNLGWIDFLGFVDFKWVYHYILVVNEKKKKNVISIKYWSHHKFVSHIYTK